MYTKYFGLTEKPFSIVPDPKVLFLSKNHENALTYLEYGLSENVGFILLTGEIGIGKTTLIRHMLNEMSAKMDIAVIFNTNFTSDQLFRRILSEFEIPCDPSGDKSLHLETLYRFLIDQYARGRHTLLIIDEAQNLADEVLEDVRMLFNLQTDNHALLQVLLVGQPDLKRRMSSPNLRQLAQRIVVSYHLSPLNEEQTFQYIHHRLKVAGAQTALFSPKAMELIFEKSGGIPRTINLLCDAGLVYAYGEDKLIVDDAIIGKVLEDKICLIASTQDMPLPDKAELPQDKPPAYLVERVFTLEAAISVLQNQQKIFTRDMDRMHQTIEELKARALESPQPHSVPVEEEKVVLTEADDDSPVDDFTFKDSALNNTDNFEDEKRSQVDLEDWPEHHFEPIHATLKPSLGKTIKASVFPYIDMTYTTIRRLFLIKYVRWIAVVVVIAAMLGALQGGKKEETTPTVDVQNTHKPMASAPPVKTVPPAKIAAGMDSKDDSLSIKIGSDNKVATPTRVEKKWITHNVQSGETLLSIAHHYDVSAIEIKKANNLKDSHLIFIGQKLKIPVYGTN